MSNQEVCKYERWTPHLAPDFSRGYIQEVFNYASDHTYQWGLEWNGELIGTVSVVAVDDFDEKAVLGYCIAWEHWSNGFVTEAVKAVLRHLFMEVGLNRIEAYHSVNNPASGRVLEKAGFQREGLAKEYYRCTLGLQDSYLYCLTRSDYQLGNE